MAPKPVAESNNQSQLPTSVQSEVITAQLEYAPEASLYPSDADEAVGELRETLPLQHGERSNFDFSTLTNPISNKDQAILLTNKTIHSSIHHASDLHRRFHVSNHLSDLDEAILQYRQVLSLVTAPHDNRWGVLTYLANTLTCRFAQTAQRPDVDEAILLNHAALDLLPSEDPRRSGTLSTLSTALFKLFLDSHQLPTLDEAISLLHESISLPQCDRHGTLTTLASYLGYRFRYTNKRTDLEEAISLNRDALHPLVPTDPRRSSTLNALATTLFSMYFESHELPALNEAISLLSESLTLPQSDRSSILTILAACLRSRFHFSGQRTDLEEAVSLNREALNLLPSADPRQSVMINTLCDTILIQHRHSGQLSDLDEAISQLREILEEFPEQSDLLDSLAKALKSRFDESGQLADLDDAIILHRKALSLLHSDDCSRPDSLSHLGFALQRRFRRSDNLEDLDMAISKHQEALSLVSASHQARWNVLNNIADALTWRFNQTGQLLDLDQIISRRREALTLRPPDQDSLDKLAGELMVRFQHLRQRKDVEDVISLHRDALSLLPLDDPSRSSALNILATAHYKLFLDSNQLQTLDEAISLLRESLVLPECDRSVILTNLASCLQSRFEFSGQRTELEDALSLNREALDLLPQADARRSFSVNTLCTTLLIHYQHTGQQSDIDEAVSLQREYLVLSRGQTDIEDQAKLLMELAKTLHRRFLGSALDQCADLDEAISFLRQALTLLQHNLHLRLPALTVLADVLCDRFHHSGEVVFLDEAIALPQKVLDQLSPSHPDRSKVLNTLSNCLIEQYNHSRQLPELDKSISLQREILDMTPLSDLVRSTKLFNLARTLERRFNNSCQVEDLNEAIATCQEISHTLVPMHPDTCVVSHTLGTLLNHQFLRTKQPDDLHDAIDAFRKSVKCESSSTSQRFFAAQRWAECADSGNHNSAMDAYIAAIGFFPRLALGLDLQSRQHVLTVGTDGLARDAAACAIRSGQFDLAVELLEEGRGVFWSQVLQLRDPLSELTYKKPELAQKLKDISHSLEQGSLRSISRHTSDSPEIALTVEQEAIKLRRLNEKWLAGLETVRKLPGFEDFLRTKRLATLRMAAANGPVVILNASKSGCAALVLRSAEVDVLHVPLPQFSLNTAKDLVDTMQKLANAAHPQTQKDRSMRRLPIAGDDEDIFRTILTTLWTSVVDPVFRSLGLKKSTAPLRLWWCPTGPFTSLPIHAAGIYDRNGSENVSEFVISSYIPTIGTLLGHPVPALDPFKMLVVIQPTGLHPLPHTKNELLKIKEHVHPECLIKYGTPEAPACIDNILLDAPAASIVHLACHGQQNLNPLDSALILDDGRLTVAQLMQLSLQNASLVFLSACETAMGDANLPDEVIHLAAALLFVGFRGAVGTMWSIRDSDGPIVADAFYGHLLSLTASANAAASAIPDGTHAAHALHLAVAKLRAETKCSFRRWVPFIHLGR